MTKNNPFGSAYSDSQLDQFLNYIQLPKNLHNAPRTPELLTQIHSHTIARIPYENLALHYNGSHFISLEPQDLFHKIVGRACGRGGYCMEVALLYFNMLKAMGFAAYTAPAKNRDRQDGVPVGDWRSWVHITTIVTFYPEDTTSTSSTTTAPQRYSSDPAFGGDGPTLPLLLGSPEIHTNLGSQQIRLIHDWLPEQAWRPAGAEGEKHKYWVYQYRNSVDKAWNSFYAFLEMEFTPTDWTRVSGFTSSIDFIHGQTPLVVKFLGRREKGGEGEGESESEAAEGRVVMYGKLMLVGDVIKENLGGKTRVVRQCVTEAERVEALRNLFGLELSPEEEVGIRGWHTEIGYAQVNGDKH